VRALQGFGAELLQSFGSTQYFEVRHVDSATTYRAHFFSNQPEAGLAGFANQSEASLAKFENLNT